MKLTCPACGAVISLDVALGHEGAREAVMLAMRLPPQIGKLLVQYVGLFRPPKRQLSMDRLASLLGELLPMIESARIERGGRSHIAIQDYWVMGLTDVINRRDTLTLPLKSHGYLLEIIAGYSAKADAKAEALNDAKRGGHTPVGYHASHETTAPRVRAPPAVPQPIPPDVAAQLGRFKRVQPQDDSTNQEGTAP